MLTMEHAARSDACCSNLQADHNNHSLPNRVREEQTSTDLQEQDYTRLTVLEVGKLGLSTIERKRQRAVGKENAECIEEVNERFGGLESMGRLSNVHDTDKVGEDNSFAASAFGESLNDTYASLPESCLGDESSPGISPHSAGNGISSVVHNRKTIVTTGSTELRANVPLKRQRRRKLFDFRLFTGANLHIQHTVRGTQITWLNRCGLEPGLWSKLLLLLAPIGILLAHTSIHPMLVFLVNVLAIIPLAAWLSFVTEELKTRSGGALIWGFTNLGGLFVEGVLRASIWGPYASVVVGGSTVEAFSGSSSLDALVSLGLFLMGMKFQLKEHRRNCIKRGDNKVLEVSGTSRSKHIAEVSLPKILYPACENTIYWTLETVLRGLSSMRCLQRLLMRGSPRILRYGAGVFLLGRLPLASAANPSPAATSAAQHFHATLSTVCWISGAVIIGLAMSYSIVQSLAPEGITAKIRIGVFSGWLASCGIFVPAALARLRLLGPTTLLVTAILIMTGPCIIALARDSARASDAVLAFGTCAILITFLAGHVLRQFAGWVFPLLKRILEALAEPVDVHRQ